MRSSLSKSLLVMVVPVLISCCTIPDAFAQQEPIAALKKWLSQEKRPAIDKQSWATSPVSKQQTKEAADFLWADHVERLKQKRQKEWEDKVIQLDELKMKFEFKTFGEADEAGRSLYISMHGGGGAPPRVNEQQWRNQIGLYKPKEGIYLAPRAPTDTWNLWHQSHIDRFFERIIQNAILFENVDPHRVYIMGYSAGGDGVYQLAPRMADRLAAAAMMAGHPNDASPLGLRNIGFALYMGGNDSAYKRNQVAAEWKEKLAQLQKNDSKGYRHEVQIFEGKGHWMDREDAVALPWMAKFRRNPFPTKIVWHQSGVTYDQFYWLAVEKPVAKSLAVVSRDGQTINIEKTENVDSIVLRVNDEMFDLDEPIVVQVGGKKAQTFSVERTIATLVKTLEERGDRSYMFPSQLRVDLK